MYQLSPNIELLFSEAGPDPAARVRAAAAAGFDAVEMWGTLDKDVSALAKALSDTGVALTSVLAEPRTNFTLPGTDLGPFFDGLARGVENARLLGAPRIVLGSGVGFPGAKRAQNLDRLVEVFSQAVDQTRGSGVKLILEPVNTRVDHPGALLDRTADAVAVARGVGSGLVRHPVRPLPLRHRGRGPSDRAGNAGDVLDYVQIADSPGRAQPGSGAIDWPASLAVLRAAGYDGPLGLEYFPTIESAESLQVIRSAAAAA